jgi:hypothetical protein
VLHVGVDWLAQYGIDDTEPTSHLRQLAWPLRSPCAGDANAAAPKLVGQQVFTPVATQLMR